MTKGLTAYEVGTIIGIISYPIIQDIIIQSEIDKAFKIGWKWMVGIYEQND